MHTHRETHVHDGEWTKGVADAQLRHFLGLQQRQQLLVRHADAQDLKCAMTHRRTCMTQQQVRRI